MPATATAAAHPTWVSAGIIAGRWVVSKAREKGATWQNKEKKFEHALVGYDPRWKGRMDRLFEARQQFNPRGWQASVLAERKRRQSWVERNAWLSSNASVTLFLELLGLAVFLVLLALLAVWILSFRNQRARRRGTEEQKAEQALRPASTKAPQAAQTAEKDFANDIVDVDMAKEYQRLGDTADDTADDLAPPAGVSAAVDRGTPEAAETAPTTMTTRTTMTTMTTMTPTPATATSRNDPQSSLGTPNEHGAGMLTNEVATSAMEFSEIKGRVEGARQTLSSIHAELPEGLTPSEKYAMTQMMLEAIKVNESCKATSSMHRMEHLAEHGNEIQSELRTIKVEKKRSEVIYRRALAIQKNTMDGLCVGVVSMVCTIAVVIWYAGSHSRTWPGLLVGMFKLRTVRTLAMSSCSGDTVVSSMTLPLPHRMLPVFTPLAQLWCHAAHAVRLIQAGILLVLTPVLISKLGLFQVGNEAPVFKLVTTCGLICGASGWYAVDWLGGRGGIWLMLWEIFVAAVIAVIVAAPRIATVTATVTPTSRCSTFQAEGWLFLGTILFGVFSGLAPFVAW